MSEFRQNIHAWSIQHRIEYIEADINLGYDYILQSFFWKEKKMLQ